jgi:hypothetical protein
VTPERDFRAIKANGQQLGHASDGHAGFWNDFRPIVSQAVHGRLAHEAFLQIIQIAFFGFLLDGGEQAAVEFGITSFNLPRDFTPVGFASSVPADDDHGGGESEQRGQRQGGAGGPAGEALNGEGAESEQGGAGPAGGEFAPESQLGLPANDRAQVGFEVRMR